MEAELQPHPLLDADAHVAISHTMSEQRAADDGRSPYCQNVPRVQSSFCSTSCLSNSDTCRGTVRVRAKVTVKLIC